MSDVTVCLKKFKEDSFLLYVSLNLSVLSFFSFHFVILDKLSSASSQRVWTDCFVEQSKNRKLSK